jgi:hypothetical protein
MGFPAPIVEWAMGAGAEFKISATIEHRGLEGFGEISGYFTRILIIPSQK